jgi:tetratricopeptide (TPR) repeat protein
MGTLKRTVSMVMILTSMTLIHAESEGERLFKTNNPAEAIPLLEGDIVSGTASPDSYNFLGLSYYQTGNYKKSVETFEKGLLVPGTNKKVLAYNEGNAAYAMADYAKAAGSYSLALAASPSFSEALLNRANAFLMGGDLQKALDDYTQFLTQKPDDPQHDQVARMMALLKAELAKREEDARIAAEQEKKRLEEEANLKAEQERLAKEKADKEAADKAAEEARRKKLLEDVANSLQDTSTENMTSGAEDVINYDTEPELD